MRCRIKDKQGRAREEGKNLQRCEDGAEAMAPVGEGKDKRMELGVGKEGQREERQTISHQGTHEAYQLTLETSQQWGKLILFI